LLALVADVDDHRFDRLVQLLVEDARRDELLAAEIPFPARVQVQDFGVGQIRVTDEDAVAFRVGIGLGRQFAELRTADGLGRAEAQLLILGEVPRRGERRQPVLLLNLRRLIGRRAAEQVARGHALLAVLEADAEGGADGRHELGVDHGVDRIDLHVGVIGVGAVRAGDLAQLQGPRIDVEVREQIVDPRATLAVGQAVDGLELQVVTLGRAGVVQGRGADADGRLAARRHRQLIGQVHAAGPDFVVQFAERNLIALNVVDEAVLGVRAVLEARFIRGVARRCGVGRAPVQLPRAVGA
uniref:NAD-specific glutamate dehydrogenase n=1 Tax=Parastrongyloides trichosuri TaxID=131310 RepID=A0A0N4ZL52_PARTI